MLNFRSPGMILGEILTVVTLAVGTANGQKPLQRRDGVVTPELKAIYDSPEYDKAYRNAEITYVATKPDPYTPAAWNSHKQVKWATDTGEQLGRYSLAFEMFKHQLDLVSENPQTRNNPKMLGQISEIQDRLTEENLSTLSVMIEGLDLGQFFTSNHKPDLAKLWVPAQPPNTSHILNGSKMGDVLKAVDTVDTCIRESKTLHVQYSRSAKFTWDVPRNEDDKPLDIQESKFFWKWDTHKKVDDAVTGLFAALSKAQKMAAEEGLLGYGSQTLRATVATTPGGASAPAATALLVAAHP